MTPETLQNNRPDAQLMALTQCCTLGGADAFISHSWHEDPDAKIVALEAWRQRFLIDRRREPRVWFDKFCIDQDNIENSLAALPIYLAGSEKLVVCYGKTYTKRLWAVMELFIFVQMGGLVEDIEFLRIGEDAPSIHSFDATVATCFLKEDADRLFAVVEAGFASLSDFNDEVRNLLASVARNREPVSGYGRSDSAA